MRVILDLRPVDEFRHTPIIPISEKDLADHKKKVDEANRKGYYVEIKKDTIYFYCNFDYPLNLCRNSDCNISLGYYCVCFYDDERETNADKDRPR